MTSHVVGTVLLLGLVAISGSGAYLAVQDTHQEHVSIGWREYPFGGNGTVTGALVEITWTSTVGPTPPARLVIGNHVVELGGLVDGQKIVVPCPTEKHMATLATEGQAHGSRNLIPCGPAARDPGDDESSSQEPTGLDADGDPEPVECSYMHTDADGSPLQDGEDLLCQITEDS